MKYVALLAAATVAGLVVSASAATIQYQENVSPTNPYDVPATEIRAASATTNYSGGTNGLDAGRYSALPTRSVISFDLKATGGLSGGETIQSVTLDLTKMLDTNFSSTSTTNKLLEIHALTHGFNGTQASWNNSATGTPWTTAGGDYSSTVLTSVTQSAANNSADTFITSAQFVAAAQDALDNNNGILNLILIAPNAEAASGNNLYVRFYNSNTTTAAYRPLLTVTTVVPEPATSALFILGGAGALAARHRK
ncbi:MAG: DNRLRE domain-containing protein [Phycisphaerales bacterium]|jgi:hypothetical protein|nr:DNRLRE domain-containing protein [Phycisphaerales bacterium]